MANWIGPGPVLIYESLILAASGLHMAGHFLSSSFYRTGDGLVWHGREVVSPGHAGGPAATLRMLALTGEKFFYALAGIQLAMVLLVAPVATAGVICAIERGAFSHSLPRPTSPTPRSFWASLVRGWRVFGFAGLRAAGDGITASLGGIDPRALFQPVRRLGGGRRAGCSLALAISARAPRPTTSSSPSWPSGCSGS